MMVPQLAAGACTPMLRNDNALSASSASAITSGASTIRVVDTLGRTSRSRIRHRGTPRQRAASTNSACLSDNTRPRIGRAAYGT